MPAPDIVDFQPQQTDAVVRLWRASFEHGVGVTDTHPLHEQVEYFRSAVAPRFRVRVAVTGGEILAFMASDAESVNQLYVRVGHIGQGIGSRLLQLAQQESAGSLWLHTYARNHRACRFYERHGFVAVEHGFEPFRQLADVKYRWVRPAGACGPGAGRDKGSGPWCSSEPAATNEPTARTRATRRPARR